MSTEDQPAPPAPDYPVSIHNRGPARGVGFTDGVLLLITERAHPPGRPLELTLQLPETMLTLSGKIVDSKRRADNRYDVRLRLSSVRREQRVALEQALGAKPQRQSTD